MQRVPRPLPGDTVNVAARLQGAAAPGEILLTEESYVFVKPQFPDAPRRELELKGKSGTVAARVSLFRHSPAGRRLRYQDRALWTRGSDSIYCQP